MTDANMWIPWQATKEVGTGALAPWGETEGAWLFQPARRMGLGTPRSSLPDSMRKLPRGQSWAIPKGALQEKRQLTREGPSACQEKNLSARGQSSTETILPGRLCSLCLGRFSRPNRISLEQAGVISSLRLASADQSDQMASWGPFQLENSSMENYFSEASISTEKMLHKVTSAGKCWFLLFRYSCNVSLFATVSFHLWDAITNSVMLPSNLFQVMKC